MESYMTPEREEYIKKLDKQIQGIDHILKMDVGTIVTTELKKQLRELKVEAAAVLKKLKNDEFEIAIVGLEKAGKSTFANALIENNLLPTKDLRCTFTSTQIEYSGDDKDDSAIVSFYTVEEFDRDFKDKLCKLGFSNYERYSFDTIDESVYTRIYNDEISEEKKKLYGDSIHEDILAIIRNVSSLSGLLGRPDIPFAADRIHSGELSTYITDQAKARAVKQVVIRSKELSKMKNAIIFDVPGFNSPTELHKIQTRERMKSADAIIVVASGISPSLTGESLKILRESDDEGNPLSDKIFVFANKTEGARDIAQNIKGTYDEWCGKGFVSPMNKHRIIFGSALAHLQNADLDSYGDKQALENFKKRENQMPQGDGIESIRSELTKYNHAERFEVLKRRVNRIRADIEKAFNDIKREQGNTSTNRNYGPEHVALVTELIDDVRPLAKKKLLDLKAEIRGYMPSEKPLSKQIEEYILNNITVENYHISDEMIDEAKKQSPYTGLHEDTGRIEGYVRELKFKEMYEDFSQNVIKIADKKHVEYSKQVIENLLNAMNIDANSPYREDLKEAISKELSVYRSGLLTSDYSSEIYYQSLIERFSRDIYQVLITSQYSDERLREFYDSIDNFYSLSVFYRTPECNNDLSYISVAPQNQPLCKMLLFHQCFNALESLKSLTDDLCRIVGLKTIPCGEYVKEAFWAMCGHKDEIIEIVEKAFSDVGDKTDDFRCNKLKTTLGKLIECNEPCSVADKDAFTSYYKNYHSSLRGGRLRSVEDVRADFNVDIEILQDVLINAFVRAINMEKPFVARETKSIDDIIDYVNSKAFGKFLSDNFWKIKYTESAKLDKKYRENEQNAAIIDEINGILNELGN